MTTTTVVQLPKKSHFMSAAQRRDARARIESQQRARAELQAELQEREERARKRARRANAAALVAGTAETRAEVAAATSELEDVLAARRKFEQEGREIERAHQAALKALDGAERGGNAAVVAYVRERLPQLQAQLHELAVVFAVFEWAQGRQGGGAEAVRNQVDEVRVQRDVAARRARMLEEIARKEANGGR